MVKIPRKAYTLEFKQEAVRLVESGQRVSEAARSLGIVEQTLANWVKAHRAGEAARLWPQRRVDGRADGDPASARRVGAGDDGARHPGKSHGVLCKGPEVKYAFIDRHRSVWPVCVQCRVLGVSATGYHQHRVRRSRIAQRRHMTDEALLAHIRAVHAEMRGAYGWPRLWRELRKRGLRVGKQRVQQLMQKHGIRARGKRRFRVATTDSRHDLPIAPNRLDRSFSPPRPNAAWAGDITYIATEEGWLFLAVVIDLFSRRVVGWSLQPHMERSLVIDALQMAWQQRRPSKGELLFHSDRGSQYASHDFARLLDEHGITASMSRKGNCWDNACSETLFGSLKVEWLHGQRFATIREAKDAVLEWLRWYNRSRMHSTLDYSSPAEYEQRWEEQQQPAAA